MQNAKWGWRHHCHQWRDNRWHKRQWCDDGGSKWDHCQDEKWDWGCHKSWC